MQVKDIRAGEWYETTMGTGECIRVGGTYPPSVQVRIHYPFPRGVVVLRPRDVQKRVPKP